MSSSRKPKLTVGSKVRLHKHWLRGDQYGKVIEYDDMKAHNWLVQFDVTVPWGGLDGNKLWLSDKDFVLV